MQGVPRKVKKKFVCTCAKPTSRAELVFFRHFLQFKSMVSKVPDNSVLASAPRLLLVICCVQVALLIYGVTIAHGQLFCMIVLSQHGRAKMDCHRCAYISYGLHFRDWFLLLSGLGVIGCGVYAAVRKSRTACQYYGIAMIAFGCSIGLAGLLIFYEVDLFVEAAKSVPSYLPVCSKIGKEMVANANSHYRLYVINSIVDLAGALFAVLSKSHFDVDEVRQMQERGHAHTDRNL